MTTAQQFFLGPTELGTNLHALQEGQPPAANAGEHGWSGNSQGWKNIWPFVDRGTSDSPQGSPGTGSTGRGWRLPAGEVGGTPTAKRYIPEGTWTIALNVTVNRTGLLGNSDFNTHVNLYRVSAGGSVGELLASDTGTAMSTNGTTSTRNHDIALPEVVFEPGETIQVEVWVSGESSAGGFLGVGSYSSTHTLNAGAATSVLVTAPGIRTKFTRDSDEEIPTEDLAAERLMFFPREIEQMLATLDEAGRSYATVRGLAEMHVTEDVVLRRQSVVRRVIGDAVFGQAILEERELLLGRNLTETLSTQPSTQFAFEGSRVLSEQHDVTVALGRLQGLRRPLDTETVEGQDALDRSVSFNRDLDIETAVVDSAARALSSGRQLAASIPTTAALGRVVNVRRFPFVDLAEAPPDQEIIITSPDLVLVDGSPAIKLADPDLYTGL